MTYEPTPWEMTDATAQAACDYEDGDMEAVSAFLAVATVKEKIDFTEEMEVVERKRARAYRAPKAAPVSTLAARNAARAWKDGTAAAERRCMAQAGR